jgi:uncharacterized protein (UPF0303 family)
MMTINRQSALEHEKELSEAPWTRQDLIELGNSIAADSLSKKLVVATAMFLNGQRVFQMALDGTSTENDLWISYKVNTVELTGHSSLALQNFQSCSVRRWISINNKWKVSRNCSRIRPSSPR